MKFSPGTGSSRLSYPRQERLDSACLADLAWLLGRSGGSGLLPKHRRVALAFSLFSGLCASVCASAATQYTTYDSLGRVVSVITADGKQTTYTYDKAGNRTQVTTNATNNPAPAESNYALAYSYGSAPPSFDPRSDTTATIVGVSPAQFGTTSFACSPNCLVTYAPSATHVAGTDVFAYTVQDPTSQLYDSALVVVTLTNPAPIAKPDNVTVAEGSFVNFDPRTNDSDPGSLTFTITGVSTPSHGTAVILSGTSITYTPTAGFWGADSFSYTITNTASQSATSTIQATVTATPPAASAIALGTAKNVAISFDPRLYAIDPQGLPTTVKSVTAPGHGTAVVVAGTSVTYTPTTNYTGTDTFNYTVANSGGGSAAATVTMTVGGPLTVTVDKTSWNWRRQFTGNTIIGAAVNAAVTGGQAPYTLVWQCVSSCSGPPAAVATAPTWLSTQWTGTVPQDNNIYTSNWVLKATDHLGAVASSPTVAVNFVWNNSN